MSLRIVIDGRPLVGERTGIGVHTAEIAGRLGEGFDAIVAAHARIENREGISDLRFRTDRSSLGVLWQQMILPRVAEEENADVVWGPHGTLPLRLRRPAVVTLHDLTSITMPHRHRLKTIASFNPIIHKSLEMAVRIIAVSRFTADEVMRGFAIDSRKIEVIPNGVSEYFSPPENTADAEPMILYAGSIEPRKGITDLLDAWEAIPRRPRLILAGSSGWKSARLRRRLQPHISSGGIVVTGYVTRETLRDLYRTATVFVYPSHFEGFGLPVLEAMACGAPVVTTSAGAIPEAAGHAAVLVPPGRPDELAEALGSLLGAEDKRRELSALGIAHAKQFSWTKAASRAGELFREAAETRR